MNGSSKLSGDNYVNWKFKLMTILEGYNLWSIVNGNEFNPTTIIEILDWEMYEVQAKVLLQMSVKDNIIHHIGDCKSSKDTWDKRKGLYESTDSN